jgi:iron complex transport system ATP-binding protein
MKQPPIISINNATMGYTKSGKPIDVLKELNLKFYEGDFIGIVGLNGVGKSTLLKSCCALLPLLSGEIYVDGLLLSNKQLADLAKKIAVVLTDKIGGFNLTTYDVVASGQMPYTNSFHRITEENHAAIETAMNSCGVKKHQHQLIDELSDGLFQKTMIAKALSQKTPILLLDEPTAFLDYASKHDLFLLLKKLAEQENKCILVSSHDLDLAVKYCNKLLIVAESTAQLIYVSEAHTNAEFKKIGGGYI